MNCVICRNAMWLLNAAANLYWCSYCGTVRYLKPNEVTNP